MMQQWRKHLQAVRAQISELIRGLPIPLIVASLLDVPSIDSLVS